MDFIKIISEIRDGNAKSFKLLYDAYSSKFKGIAYRYTNDSSVANDMVQESFIKIYKNINSYKGDGNFEGWMKRILINNCLNNIKKEKKYTFEISDVLLDRPSSEWDEAIDALSFDEILVLVNKLPIGYKTVFNLSVFEGYAHKEIGELLGISESASRSQLTKAKSKLKEELKNINIFSSRA
ncbi:MAG: RNA polymerase sigma factor (sigma-70 family) [Crocinitomix sp.]|jgi:RNA polymerase sigma factor (sigma-70 family)